MDYSDKEVNGSVDTHYSLVVEFKVNSTAIPTFAMISLKVENNYALALDITLIKIGTWSEVL
jgi:hypothetical protein